MKRLLTGAALALALASPVAAQDASTVIATVNGTEITLGNLIALRGRLPEQFQELPDEVLYQAMVDQLVTQQVLADVAREDLSQADEVGLANETRAFLADRVLRGLGEGEIDEAEVQAMYEERFGNAEGEGQFNASHILVESEAEARALGAQLADGADFATLARENSTGPSGPNGGQLGWFGAGQMVPAFEEAVKAMEPGQVSEPVQTQFGWHVIKLNETRQQDVPPLDAVRAEIETGLRDQAVQAEIDRLSAAAEIDRSDVEIDPAAIRDDSLLGE